VTRIFSGSDRLYASAAATRSYDRSQHLLFAGTWLGRKGIRDLVEAFTSVAIRHPYVTLTVLGAGQSPAAVLSCFREDLRSRIHCVHASNDGEAARVFAESDIFVLPSLFEGTPLTLIEAMMSGLPIVTTATCGMKDVIRDGGNGLLVPIRSSQAIAGAVEQFLQDAALRDRLGRAARLDALAQFTWDRVSIPIRETYERLCAKPTYASASAGVAARL